jgi:dihydroorotate dehydrogenase electron transfer subunit
MVTELARSWLAAFPSGRLDEVQIVGCGPMPMLAALATLAKDYGLPCQVAVEEYMACGVGGCAGCTILVRTPAGPAMKRVCVDGPVFEAQDVFPL